MTFRVNAAEGLIAFAGSDTSSVVVDGRSYAFADEAPRADRLRARGR